MEKLRTFANQKLAVGRVSLAAKLSAWSRRLDPNQPSVRPADNGNGLTLSFGSVDIARIEPGMIKHERQIRRY